jgi:hypothetical protein
MNVETGTKAAQFPEKEYINGDFCCSVLEKHISVTQGCTFTMCCFNSCKALGKGLLVKGNTENDLSFYI